MTKFVDGLQKETDRAYTGNGDITYKDTLSANLDLFSKAGGARGNDFYFDISTSAMDYIEMFKEALNEDENIALRNLLNIRDFRHSGKGERLLFRELISYLAQERPTIAKKLIESGIVEQLGRWDDLIFLFEYSYNQGYHMDVLNAIVKQIKQAMNETPVSLVYKWLPTNTRNKRVYKVANELYPMLGYHNFKEYRKDVSAHRKSLKLIETYLSDKDYDPIEVSHIPSRAFNKYQSALVRHIPDKMDKFYSEVSDGTKKVKVSGITPDEIVSPLINDLSCWWDDSSNINKSQMRLIEESWKEMIKNNKDIGNSLVVADVSGSMTGKPMEVSVSLAMLFGQAMTGEFHNTFMTFASTPQLIKLSDNDSLRESVKKVLHADWDTSTDIDAVFEKILDTAKNNHLEQKDMPERIVIISDMQFDSAVSDKPHIERWKESFKQAEYKLPTIVYWNVSSYNNSPATKDEENVALVSGFTQGTLDAVINSKDITPASVMLEALNKPEYDIVDEILK